MADDELNLQNAVKNARSAFYAYNNGKKRKQTRKEARRAARISKKSKHNLQQTKQDAKKETQEETQIPKKKRKRKRKKKTECENEELSYDRVAYEAANKIDEKIISSLEKKLCGSSKKKDKLSLFKEDGLDYVLEVCEPFTGEDGHGYSSDEEYLKSKSKKVKKVKKEDDTIKLSAKTISDKLLFEDGEDDFENGQNEKVQGNDDDDGDKGSDNEVGGKEDEDDDNGDIYDEDTCDGSEDEMDEADECYVEDNEDENEEDEEIHRKENFPDDIVTTTANKHVPPAASKYVPPALRNKGTAANNNNNNNNNQELKELRIRKTLKGLLNRVSDGTLPNVVSEIETMYSNNSRNFMNEVLYKMVVESCVSTITTPEKLVLQHIVITAALHMLIGSEVGAYFLEMLSKRFSTLHEESPLYGEGKTCHNVVLMLISLYNLKVVDCLLIYDLIRVCLTAFGERDIELIFLVLKTCGPDLRKDDPAALKDVILTVHTKASQYPAEDKSYVNFMLETINALKNNNTRKIPLYDGTIVDDARKSLKSIVQGKCKTSSGIKLKVSLDDLLNADDKGRWWITGSAWTGHGPVESTLSTDLSEEDTGFSATVLKAAKKQRMNTSIRKQIFCVMVSSEDYIDAFEKLLKLNLTEKQFREVVHVLVDCCLQEKTYNPFYVHLADKLCEFNKSNQVTFQYSLWDRFKTISTMKKHNLSNLERFLAHMIASKSLSLSVLKVVSFAALDQHSIRFFTNFFTIFLLEYPINNIKASFHRIANLPKLGLLRQGIKLFLRQFLHPEGNTEINAENKHSEKMKEIIDIVESAIDGCEYVPL